ncbi:hypothetical protein OWV82_002229 [Melia azedarach]|uniref:Uncharacterized protein n=1 Tax=Melia azedarach TaxID=155640 RepID=A0ACC1Z2G2_MELAZ|nr:hypothetical protein OWV82_002229 [Melia azedarach]
MPILRSQNCLRNSLLSPRFNKCRPNPNPTLSQSRPRRNRCPSSDRPRSPVAIKLIPGQNNLVVDKVRILKRGEEVPPCLIKNKEPSEILKKQIEVCSGNVEPHVLIFFSGWSFVASPPPSSVPLPAVSSE